MFGMRASQETQRGGGLGCRFKLHGLAEGPGKDSKAEGGGAHTLGAVKALVRVRLGYSVEEELLPFKRRKDNGKKKKGWNWQVLGRNRGVEKKRFFGV